MAKAASKPVKKLLSRAEEALNRKNYQLAIFNYIRALTLEPENIEARLELRVAQANSKGRGFVAFLTAMLKAKILSGLKKYEQSIIACEHALAAKPENIGMMTLLADNAEKLDGENENRDLRLVAAWQLQLIVSKYDPENIAILWQLGRLYEDIGEAAKAVECYEMIGDIDPEEDVSPAIRNAQALMTSETYREGVEKGAHHIQADQEASEQYERDAGKLRDDEARLKTINYLLDNDCVERPNDHKLWLRLGEIYFDFDDWKMGYTKAKEYLEKAHELMPSDNTVMDKMGDLEIKSLRHDLLALQQAAKANPNDAVAKKAFHAQNKKYLTFEIGEYERRVEAQPLKMAFHHRLGNLYFKAKRYDDAIGELQRAARDPKVKLLALTTLGRCFQGNNQADMAITQFQKAREGQEMFQRIREPLYYEAEAWETKGDKESSAEAYQKALELFTNIYEVEINFRDVKTRVPNLQKKLREATSG